MPDEGVAAEAWCAACGEAFSGKRYIIWPDGRSAEICAACWVMPRMAPTAFLTHNLRPRIGLSWETRW